jgi:hypothetical protein
VFPQSDSLARQRVTSLIVKGNPYEGVAVYRVYKWHASGKNGLESGIAAT